MVWPKSVASSPTCFISRDILTGSYQDSRVYQPGYMLTLFGPGYMQTLFVSAESQQRSPQSRPDTQDRRFEATTVSPYNNKARERRKDQAGVSPGWGRAATPWARIPSPAPLGPARSRGRSAHAVGADGRSQRKRASEPRGAGGRIRGGRRRRGWGGRGDERV